MQIRDGVAISSLAAPGSAEDQFLTAADADGDGRVTPQEFEDQVARPLPSGMTRPKVDALATGFLNTLAPGQGGGVNVSGSPGGVVLPNDFTLSEHLGTAIFGGSTFATFDLKDESGKTVASLERRWRSKGFVDALKNGLAPTFTMRNPAIRDKDENVVAEAKPVVLDTKELSNNFRNVINIEDGQGRHIGMIRERWGSTLGSVLQRAFLGGTVATWYEVCDASGKVIAQSDKQEILATNMDIRADDHKVANVHRGFLNSLVRDKWNVEVSSNEVDRRILAFVAAYKTWADKAAAEQRAAEPSDDN